MAKAAVRTSARLRVGGKDQAHHWSWFALLGIVLIAGGTFMLGNLAVAAVVSTLFIGATFLVLGVFQLVEAFNTKGWSGTLFSAALGILYALAGIVLWANPLKGAVTLTFLIAAMLVAS